MASSQPLADSVPRDAEVFRACTNKNFLNNTRSAIRDRAYLRRKKDTDGLSLGLTPDEAVRELSENFGIIGVFVGAVEDIPERHLSVRPDPDLPGHALLNGLPYVEENETLATDIAWELVNVSRIVYSSTYYPAGHPQHQAS
jgi:hypothetical protein